MEVFYSLEPQIMFTLLPTLFFTMAGFLACLTTLTSSRTRTDELISRIQKCRYLYDNFRNMAEKLTDLNDEKKLAIDYFEIDNNESFDDILLPRLEKFEKILQSGIEILELE